MNDRIKELALIAHSDAVESYRERMKTEFAGNVIFSDMYDQRFAELIVQECVDVCDAYGMPDGTSPVARIISKVIKHKFGINE